MDAINIINICVYDNTIESRNLSYKNNRYIRIIYFISCDVLMEKKFSIPYFAVNSRVISSLAYVTSKCRCRNMGRTRAIRIERCFRGTMGGLALDGAAFSEKRARRYATTSRFLRQVSLVHPNPAIE